MSITITNNHQCDDCRTLNHATMPGWSSIRRFFSHIDDCLTEGSPLDDPTAENLKMTELLYLIVSHGDCCIKSKLLGNVVNIAQNGLPLDYLEDWTQRVEALTTTQVRAAVQRKLQPDRMVTIVLGAQP